MQPDSVSTETRWPLKSLLWVGYFGKSSPEGRRYHNRCLAVGVVFGAVILASAVFRRSRGNTAFWLDWPTVQWSQTGAFFAFIAFWQYLGELDELARRILFEAIALTYLTGLGAFGFLTAFGYQNHWTVNPVWFIFLEPVRGFGCGDLLGVD